MTTVKMGAAQGKKVLAFPASPFCFLSNIKLDIRQLKLRALHRKFKTQQRVFFQSLHSAPQTQQALPQVRVVIPY